MQRLFFCFAFIFFSATTAIYASEIVYIKAEQAEPLLELKGEWQPDEKMNRKLMKKAERDMRKKMQEKMPKPPIGAGGPRGGGMPGGGGPGSGGMGGQGGGMGGPGGPGGGMGGPGGRMPPGGRPKGMPEINFSMVASMIPEEMSFAAPASGNLSIQTTNDLVRIGPQGTALSDVRTDGKPQEISQNTRMFGSWGKQKFFVEFINNAGANVAYTYSLEEEGQLMRLNTYIYSPIRPNALQFDRVFRRVKP